MHISFSYEPAAKNLFTKRFMIGISAELQAVHVVFECNHPVRSGLLVADSPMLVNSCQVDCFWKSFRFFGFKKPVQGFKFSCGLFDPRPLFFNQSRNVFSGKTPWYDHHEPLAQGKPKPRISGSSAFFNRMPE